MADSSNFFTLFESSAGYALLEVVAIEEINPTDKANQKTIVDLSLFSRSVKLKAFQPFSSAEDALENANAISEHAMTDSLKSFLEMNLPQGILFLLKIFILRNFKCSDLLRSDLAIED